jgi:hypothetical protein
MRPLLLTAALAAGLLLASAGGAQPAPSKAAELLRLSAEGAAAREKGDAEGYLAAARGLLALGPDQPILRSAWARALAFAGRDEEAIGVLKGLADAGFGLSERDRGLLEPLKRHPSFAAVDARLKANLEPRGKVGSEIVLDRRDLVPEGVVWDAKRRVYYVGSLVDGGLYEVGPGGRTRALHRETQPNRSTVGLRLTRSGQLFACSSPQQETATDKLSQLLSLDPAAAAPEVRRTVLPAGPDNAYCNDMVELPDGRLVITDFDARRLSERRPDGSIAAFAPEADFFFPNGIAASPDGRRIYVADFFGVTVIDGGGKVLGRLQPPPGESLGGLDGLYEHRGWLIGVQGITAPTRLIRARLGPGLTVSRIEVLAANHPSLADATTATLTPEGLRVLARTGLRGMSKGKAAADAAAPALVLVPLD